MTPSVWYDAARVALPLLAGAAVGGAVRGVLRRIGRAQSGTLAERLGLALALPLGCLCFVAVAWSGLSLWRPAAQDAQGTVFVLAVAACTLLVDRLVGEAVNWHLHGLARHTGSAALQNSLAPLARQLLRGLLFFIGAVVVLANFHVNITAFVTTAGVASLAFALAAQDTLANLFAGVAILFDRPFRVGDRVEVAGVVGDVTQIGLRTTRIRTSDNNMVVIPNKEIVATQLTNRAYPDLAVAVHVQVGVGYGSDVVTAKQRMLEVAAACPEVLAAPAPVAYFTGFGDWALNLTLWVYIGDYRRQAAVLDQLNLGILESFREAGIEIPSPQRVVTLQRPVPESGPGDMRPAETAEPSGPGVLGPDPRS